MGDRFYSTVRTLSLLPLKCWLRLRVQGLAKLPAAGPMLVVANHTSYLDPALLGRACPRKLHFLIRRRIYETWGLEWFFRNMDSLPVSLEGSDSKALRAAFRLLDSGEAVGIFPEGARSHDGRLGEAKIGAALLATRSGCPVVPAVIRGAYESMPVGAAIPRPGRVDVVFGNPFAVERRRGDRNQLQEVARRIMSEIARLQNGEREAHGQEVEA